ncbi:hypothetical protein F0A16_20500 [Salinicola corii]|uniref:Uncharacterized protein n=1 Tax=Salinicola corii TaxID=2606937 RepID=A0A640W955_9GAMM|nr:hypothetical protein [Salinicola corii]KAA0015472.1 hypothetical protein F0A16_20500 [Salinicola corii]
MDSIAYRVAVDQLVQSFNGVANRGQWMEAIENRRRQAGDEYQAQTIEQIAFEWLDLAREERLGIEVDPVLGLTVYGAQE